MQKCFKLAEKTTGIEYLQKIQELNEYCSSKKWNIEFTTASNVLKIKSVKKQAGRPLEHDIKYDEIVKMKANGMKNKEIYTKLGISKSLFYLKMKEHNNSNSITGHCKGG